MHPYIYDQVPYSSFSYLRTHPNHLATLAALCGMKPPPIEHCRVLELGCASGGNLIPMAYSLPEFEFVGIDASKVQIAAGRDMVSGVQKMTKNPILTNISLDHLDILEVDTNLGQFDYIIAHGVYSWVDSQVREKIFEICQQQLNPNGVAYISYNTYPGWHMLEAVRNMMLYHIQKVTDPQARIREARNFLDFLSRSVPDKYTTYTSFLSGYLSYVNESISLRSDASLLHEELEDVNFPIYFSQFIEQAEEYGLQYLVEASFQTMIAKELSEEVSGALRQMVDNSVEYEQYLDFLHNRTFRQSLLCHSNIQLNGDFIPEQVKSLYIASPARPESSNIDVHSYSTEKFYVSEEEFFSTSNPITKAAMVYLNEIWPQEAKFDILVEKAGTRLAETLREDTISRDDSSDAHVLANDLLSAYSHSRNLVELHTYVPQFTRDITEQPMASPVARFQVKNGTVVTNLRHERIDLEGSNHYHLLPYLDGTRDCRALLEIWEGLADEGIITLQKETDLEEELNSILSRLANAALLVD